MSRITWLSGALCNFIACCMLLPLVASAQNAAPVVNRDDLLRRAFQSTGFVLMNAGSDRAFYNSLSENELIAFAKIANVANVANNRGWLNAKGVHNFSTSSNEDAYVYIVSGTEEGVRTVTKGRSELQIIDDSDIFKLPGKPPRAAVTTSDPLDPIYVNRLRISQRSYNLNFAEAVSFAVHEYGNKLGDVRDQDSIDRVAAKIRSFVESRTRQFRTSIGNIELVLFPNAPFEDLSQLSFTPPAQGGLPQLRLYGDEGLYAFLDTGNRIVDFSSELMKPATNSSIRKLPQDSDYQWLDLRWVLGSFPKVTEGQNGELSLSMSLQQNSVYVPFAHARSPNPQRTMPWTRANRETPLQHLDHSRMEWSLKLEAGALRVEKKRKSVQTIEDASFSVTKVSSFWQGSDLVLTYSLPNRYEVPNHQGGPVEIEPYLIAEFNGETIEILGVAKAGLPNQFEFRFENLKNEGDLKLVGMELGGLRSEFLLPANLLRVKVILPASDLFQVRSEKPRSEFKLRARSIRPDGVLKLMFDSETPLSSLVMYESYLQSWQGTHVPVDERGIFITADELKQTVKNGKLLVEWKVDQGLLYKDPLDSKALQYSLQVQVLPERLITGLRATNQSLQVAETFVEKPLKFNIEKFKSTPLRCEAAF